MRTTIIPAVALGALCFTLLAGCAGSPMKIAQMNSAEIQATKTENLCRAYATYVRERKVPPVVEQEVARRGVTCQAELEAYISDCREVELVSARNDSTYKNVRHFTVRNSSAKTKEFLIADVTPGIVSSRFTIAPNTTKDVAVVTDEKIGAIGAVSSQFQRARGTQPRTTNCFTVR
jgi:hypothetical protein